MPQHIWHQKCSSVLIKEVARITQTIYGFEDPEIEIKDPRKEAAEVFAAIKGYKILHVAVCNSYL